MGKIDQLKEIIGWLKVWLGICIAGEFGLIGWFISNYKKAETFWLILDVIAIIIFSIAIIMINKMGLSKIKELEEL
jgi:hypothetical protein